MDRRRLMMNDTIETLDGKPIITCKRSKGSKFADLKLFGKSEQFNTTGANLFNVSSKQSGFVSGIVVGDKVKVSQNASYPKAVYFDEIAVDPTKRYSFCFWDGSTVLSNDNVRIRIYNDDNVVTETSVKNNIVNKKFAYGTTKVRVLILDEFPNLIGMFCEGSTLKAYEPYTGGQPSPSPDYPQEIKSVVNPVAKISNGDGTESQTIQLPYTLNAIPVPSGGNYTDENGQQWIADYVDMAKGKLVRLVDSAKMDNTQSIVGKTDWLLAVPVETILTDEEITAYKALHTYTGITNISNDAEAWMQVGYRKVR